MKRFAQVFDKTRLKEYDFLSWQKDENSAGYILSYYTDPQKNSIKEDWFLELEELLSFTESEYGIDPEKWIY